MWTREAGGPEMSLDRDACREPGSGRTDLHHHDLPVSQCDADYRREVAGLEEDADG